MLTIGHYPASLDVKDIDRSVTDEDRDELLNTPVRTVRSDRADGGSPIATRVKPRSSPLMVNISSSPMAPTALSLGTLEYDNESVDDDDESRWSCAALDSRMSLDDDFKMSMAAGKQVPGLGLSLSNPKKHTTFAVAADPAPPRRGSAESKDGTASKRDTRSNLFEWSEQQHLEKSSTGKSPPRPRTVHGKKDHADRGSRSVGRRAPSGLHARSQSVPVAPGMAGKRVPVVTNKFGTWGVGSKGVSEDWDEDFDFGDDEGPLPALNPSGAVEERRVDSGSGVMRIPQTIRDQQVKVVNNIGLVREFGLLIEELKAIRHKLVESGATEFAQSELGQEIDAMIELADREVDDPFPFKDSPPTPYEFDPFEESQPAESAVHTPPQPWHTPNPRRSRSQRRSVLPYENNDVFSTPITQPSSSLVLNSSPANTVTPPATNRPRKDSEAMARSVIEALHRRKDTQDSNLSLKPVPTQQKVLFDTNTLRYIVSHVQDLLKRVKVDLPSDFTVDTTDSIDFGTPTAQQPQQLERLFRTVPSWPQTGLERRMHAIQDHTSHGKDDEDAMDLDLR
jgi:hypothetical protein